MLTCNEWEILEASATAWHTTMVAEGFPLKPLDDFLESLLETDRQWYNNQAKPEVSFSTFYTNRKAGHSRSVAIMRMKDVTDRQWYYQQDAPQVSYSTYRRNLMNGESRIQAIKP